MKSLFFSSNELYRCLTHIEKRNMCLTEDIFTEKSKQLVEDLSKGLYQFSFKQNGKIFLNSKTDSFEFLFQNLVLRNIYKNIKAVYKINQADRDKIISQIKILLEEKNPYWIIKLDIKSFFESIDKQKIIQSLKNGCSLNSQTISLLEQVLSHPTMNGMRGLPRGLCISSVMSELYLEKFDIEIKGVEGVYYYARFVDDIIVFCTSKLVRDEIECRAKELLDNLGLSINNQKVQKWQNDSADSLSYLGYAFRHNRDKLSISIADNKIKKLKSRIVKSFVAYSKNNDYQLLKKRIRFLTGNTIFFKKKYLLPVFVGIHYNYKRIDDEENLRELDGFYRKILNCKRGKLGNAIKNGLDDVKIKELSKYSFKFGHDRKVRHFFSTNEIKDITRCWQCIN